MRVATHTRILLATLWTLVEITDGTPFSPYLFSPFALLVQQYAQVLYRIAGNRGLVVGYRIVAVMRMPSRCAIHTVREVNKLVCDRYLYRLALHCWLNKNQVPVSRAPFLASSGTHAPRRYWQWRNKTITAKCHNIEPLPRPLPVFVTVLSDCKEWKFKGGEMQFAPVVCKPMLKRCFIPMNNWTRLKQRRPRHGSYLCCSHERHSYS